ncbi:MAG: hypothetical protein ACMXYG_06580 [Candidatus Woesearchaeota archaeon]
MKKGVHNLSLDDALKLEPGDILQFNPDLTEPSHQEAFLSDFPNHDLVPFELYEFEKLGHCHTHGKPMRPELPAPYNDYVVFLRNHSKPIHYSWLANATQLLK